MTTGNPARLILFFSVPLLIGNIFQQLYFMADMAIVSRTISLSAMAAVGATGALTFLVFGFFFGLTNGFAVITAQRFGAKDYDGVRRSVAVSTLLGTAATGLGMLVSLPFIEQLLRLMNTPDDILADSAVYVAALCWGNRRDGLLQPALLFHPGARRQLDAAAFSRDRDVPEHRAGFALHHHLRHGDRRGGLGDRACAGAFGAVLPALHPQAFPAAVSAPGGLAVRRRVRLGASARRAADGLSVLDHSDRRAGHAGGDQPVRHGDHRRLHGRSPDRTARRAADVHARHRDRNLRGAELRRPAARPGPHRRDAMHADLGRLVHRQRHCAGPLQPSAGRYFHPGRLRAGGDCPGAELHLHDRRTVHHSRAAFHLPQCTAGNRTLLHADDGRAAPNSWCGSPLRSCWPRFSGISAYSGQRRWPGSARRRCWPRPTSPSAAGSTPGRRPEKRNGREAVSAASGATA